MFDVSIDDQEVIDGLQKVPEFLGAGLTRYLFHGVRPGGFLCAVIDNDLLSAVGRAGDGIDLDALRCLTRFFYNDCPFACWGSSEKREAWEKSGGIDGLFATAKTSSAQARKRVGATA